MDDRDQRSRLRPGRRAASTRSAADLPFGAVVAMLRAAGADPGRRAAVERLQELAETMPLASGHRPPRRPVPAAAVARSAMSAGGTVITPVETGRASDPAAGAGDTAIGVEPGEDERVPPLEPSLDQALEEVRDAAAAAWAEGIEPLLGAGEVEPGADRDGEEGGGLVRDWVEVWADGWCHRSGAARPRTWEGAADRLAREGLAVARLLDAVGVAAGGSVAAAPPTPDGAATRIATVALGAERLRELGPILAATGGCWLPVELDAAADVEDRLVDSARQGWGVDRRILAESRPMVGEVRRRLAGLLAEAWDDRANEPEPRRTVAVLLARVAAETLATIERWNDEAAILTPAPAPWAVLRLRLHARAAGRRLGSA